MRLFDAEAEVKKAEADRRSRADVRERAAAVEKLLAENQELDVASRALELKLGVATQLEAIRYVSFRPPGSRWLIEHAKAGKDYIYQLFPLKPTQLGWTDVISHMIVAMDAIFPRTIQIRYLPPNEAYQMKKFYTIKVQDVVGLPGWQTATEKVLHALVRVEAWQT